MRVDPDRSNDYVLSHRLDDHPPASPWAIYLTGADGRFWYLCFDLDVKNGNAPRDARRLRSWLDELAISHVECESGPTGGRHVWVALSEPVESTTVGTIAQLATQLLPSLDAAPMCNAVTGCVRPPFAPHRAGGRSQPRSTVEALLQPTTTASDIELLQAFLMDAGASVPNSPASTIKGMAHDNLGHPYLVGQSRPLSPRVRDMLNASPNADTSRTQAAVLAGLARARWRYADVLALLHETPALEHARSRPAVGGRTPRSKMAAAKALAADWARAVHYVAANPVAHDGEDEEFHLRSLAISEMVGACQDRADAMAGRWGCHGVNRSSSAQRRHSHRAVLDAVCLYLTQSVRPDVEVDIRRLARDTGYGRETCRLALIALARPDVAGDPESAWLVRVEAAHGVHGARYRLSERFSTPSEVPKWPQAVTRPVTATGPEQRTWWLTTLSQRLSLLAHDVFVAPGSVGRTAGKLFACLPTDGQVTLHELAQRAGIHVGKVRLTLRRLSRFGLAAYVGNGWSRNGAEMRDHVAAEVGVTGYLAQRWIRYTNERSVWAWWSAECTWLRKRGKTGRGRRAASEIVLIAPSDRPEFPRYPRRSNGDPDHQTAMLMVKAGALESPRVSSVAA